MSKPSTVEEMVSYGIGRQMGDQLKSQPFEGMDIEILVTGLRDAIEGKASEVSDAEMQKAFAEINQRLQAQQAEQAKELAADGEKFLAENAKREEVTVLESGLQFEVLTEGSGDKPTKESTVRTHYHGTLINGEVFDSSYNRGEPAEFPVGGVIAGWTEALQMMPVGSKWRLYVPYNLAYGERGAGGSIGPYATLIFDVELLDILS